MNTKPKAQRVSALAVAAVLCASFVTGCSGSEKLGPYPVHSTGLLATPQSYLKPGRSVLVPENRPPGIEKVVASSARIEHVEDLTFELTTDRVHAEHYREGADVAFGCEVRPAQTFCFELDPGVPGWQRTVIMSTANSKFSAEETEALKKFFKNTRWVELREATW